MSMKYVRGEEVGFILSPHTDRIWHSHVARVLREPVISAGFVRFVDGKPECYGMSESLSVASREGDSEALAKQLGLSAS